MFTSFINSWKSKSTKEKIISGLKTTAIVVGTGLLSVVVIKNKQPIMTAAVNFVPRLRDYCFDDGDEYDDLLDVFQRNHRHIVEDQINRVNQN
jgi:hypothetical protein